MHIVEACGDARHFGRESYWLIRSWRIPGRILLRGLLAEFASDGVVNLTRANVPRTMGVPLLLGIKPVYYKR